MKLRTFIKNRNFHSNLIIAGFVAIWTLWLGPTLARGASSAPESHGAPAAHGEESDEIEHLERKKPNRIVIVQPKKELDPQIAAEEVLRYLEAGKTEWNGGDYVFAEQYFAAALGIPANIPEKEIVLNTMGKLYKHEGMYPKSAAVFERLAKEFPESRRLPEIYMELGNIYRSMGAIELAISKYYMVMNSSLNVSFDQLEKYRELSLKAKLAIAESHAEREEYSTALEKYENLFRLDLKPVERMLVHFKKINLLFELNSFQQTVSQAKLFIDQYTYSAHAPEIRYLLAKSYERLNRKPEALREVIEILQSQSSPDTADPESGDYWKQRMGNELANEFYEKGDYRSALTIYQSLARYSDNPTWRWPAIHQIGLCFERLGLPEKAQMAYEEILKTEDDAGEPIELTASLQSIQSMAKWRLDHLSWEDELMNRLHVLRTQ